MQIDWKFQREAIIISIVFIGVGFLAYFLVFWLNGSPPDGLSIGGIVFSAIFGIVIFRLQERLSEKIDKIILEDKERRDRRKRYYLRRIIHDTKRIRDNLAMTDTRIQKYLGTKDPKDLQIVFNHAKMASDTVVAIAPGIMEDFRMIVDLIDDPYIFDKFSTVNIMFTSWVYGDVLAGREGRFLDDFSTLLEKINCQVEKLDDTLERMNKEMPVV